MHALIVTFNPDSAYGEELLKALSRKLGLKRIRFETYLCHFADRHIQRLVGRVQRSQVLVDQALRVNGVPFDYQAHIAIRGAEFLEERAMLKQFENKLRCSGYSCQLLVSGESDEMEPVSKSS